MDLLPIAMKTDLVDWVQRPLEVYGLFDAAEVNLIRTFSEIVRELETEPFFALAPSSVSFTFDARGMTTKTDRPIPGRSVMRSVLVLFRQIYSESEEASVNKVIRVLSANANQRNGPFREQATRGLRNTKKHLASIKNKDSGIAYQVDSMGFTPEEIVRAYMHGRYLHRGADKVSSVQALDAFGPLPEFTSMTTLIRLSTKIYSGIADSLDLILAEPSLASSAQVPGRPDDHRPTLGHYANSHTQ